MIKTYENFNKEEISLVDDILSNISTEYISHDQEMQLRYAIRNKLSSYDFSPEETILIKKIFDGDLDNIEDTSTLDSIFKKYYKFEEEIYDLIDSLKFKWKDEEIEED